MCQSKVHYKCCSKTLYIASPTCNNPNKNLEVCRNIVGEDEPISKDYCVECWEYARTSLKKERRVQKNRYSTLMRHLWEHDPRPKGFISKIVGLGMKRTKSDVDIKRLNVPIALATPPAESQLPDGSASEQAVEPG